MTRFCCFFIICALAGSCIAQEKSGNSEAPKTAYKQLKKQIQNGNFEAAVEFMTPEAADAYVFIKLTKAEGLILANEKHNLDTKAGRHLKKVMEKYGLRKVKAITSSPKKTNNEKLKKRLLLKRQKEALKALDEKGDRWDILNKLWVAGEDSIYQMGQLTGKVEKVELVGDVAFLQTKPVSPSKTDPTCLMVQGMSMPMVIKMEKSEGKWKYVGVDDERTTKAMEKKMRR